MKRIFYVYAYIDPDTLSIFYIGKGHGDRYKSHLYPSQLKRRTHKNHKIQKILSEGKTPIIEFISSNLMEKDAFELEIEAIRIHGRVDDGTGTLLNHTSGGEGMTGWTDERREKYSLSRKDKINARDRQGNVLIIERDDPRWLNGELQGMNKGYSSNVNGKLSGYVQAKDVDGNVFRVKQDDPRWISGELIGINKGIPAHPNTVAAAKARKGLPGKPKSEEHKQKLREAALRRAASKDQLPL